MKIGILILIALFFSGCEPQPPEVKYVKQKCAQLKILYPVNVKKIEIRNKKVQGGDYIIPKTEMKRVAKASRYEKYLLKKQIQFYINQNIKHNKLFSDAKPKP